MTAVAQLSDAPLEGDQGLLEWADNAQWAAEHFWPSTQHQICRDAVYCRISHFNAQAVSFDTNIKQLVICVSAENIHGARCLQKC